MYLCNGFLILQYCQLPDRNLLTFDLSHNVTHLMSIIVIIKCDMKNAYKSGNESKQYRYSNVLCLVWIDVYIYILMYIQCTTQFAAQ